MTESAQHRWSGWPGAWCLDCGIEDPREVCLAEGHGPIDPYDDTPPCSRAECVVGPCPEPGSKRHDPYAARKLDE